MKKLTAVSDIVRRMEMERRVRQGRSEQDLYDRWEEIVGLPEAEAARPVSLRGGTLTLSADSSPAAQEADFAQNLYIERVNRHLGREAVRRVRIEHRGRKKAEPKRSARTAQPKPKPELDSVRLSDEEQADIQRTAAKIQSAGLRAAFERAASTRLKREKWERNRSKTGASPKPK